jgi:hypothetical protein
MAIHGQDNEEILHVTLGEDEILGKLTLQYPDAVAAANRRIASIPRSPTLIAQFTAEELSEDRSDEMAIVGKLKK